MQGSELTENEKGGWASHVYMYISMHWGMVLHKTNSNPPLMTLS